MRERRRAAVIIFLAGVVLLVAVGLFLTGNFPQEPLRQTIESRLRQGLGAGSSLGSVRIVPGRLQMELRDLVLVGETYRLVVPRAFVHAKLDFLLGNGLLFNVVQAESPHLTIRPSDTPSARKPLLRQLLIIDSVELVNGTVVYEGGQAMGDLELRGVDARGKIGLGTLEVSVKDGTWRRDRALDLESMHALLRISSRLDVTIDASNLSTPHSHLNVAGRLGILGMLEPDVQVDGHVDLREAAILRTVPEMQGVVSVRGRVKDAGRVVADAFLEGSGLKVAGWPLDQVQASLKHGHRAAGRTDLEAKAALLGGHADARVDLRGTRADGIVHFRSIDLDRLRHQGIAIGFPESGQVSGTVTGGGDLRGTLNLDAQFEGSGRGAGFALHARGSAKGEVETRRARVDLDWRMVVDADPLRRVGAGALRLGDAHITARGRASGAMPPAIDATFEGVATTVSESGRERVPLSGRLRYRSQVLTADVSAKGLGGSVQAALEQRGAVVRRLDATVRSINLASLLRDARGTLDAQVRAQGLWRALSGSGTANVAGLVWRDMDVGEASARFLARRGVADVSFSAPGLNATGSGTATARGFRGTVLLADASLERLQPLLSPNRPLSGVVSGTVNLDVPWGNTDAAVVVANLDRAEVTSGTLSARARQPFRLEMRGRRVTVHGLEVEGPGMDFRADGSLSLSPQGPLDLRLRGNVDLARVPAPTGWTMRGVATGDVHLTGTRTRPRASGLIAMKEGLIERPGTPPIHIADGEILLEGDVATARNLSITMAQSTLQVTGRIPLTAVVGEEMAKRLGFDTSGVTELTARLDVSLSDLPVPPPWTLTGRIEGDAVISGTLSRPRATGDVALRDALLLRHGVPVASVAEGHLLLAGDAVEIPGLTAEVAEGTATLSGRIPLAALLGETRAERFQLASGEASLRLAWQDVEAAALYETLRPDRISPVHGTLAGQAVAEGQFTGWDAIRGRLETPATTIRVEEEQLQVDPLLVELQGGRLTTPGLKLTVHETTFLATGEADLVARTVAVRAEGEIALRVVSLFIEDVSMSGQAYVAVDVSGPLSSPRPLGNVEMRDATLRIRDMRMALTDMKARLVLEPGAVRVEEASALLGGGTLAVTGGGRLEGLRLADLKLDLTGRDVALRYPVGGRYGRPIWDDLKARVDADLTLTGRPGSFLLAGTLNADRALYDADIFLEEAFLPPQIPPDAGQPSRLRRSIALNIAVTMENPLVVRNNLAELQAEGTLSLRGDLQDIAPFGRLEVHPGGKVLLQGREFTISSGTLVYQGTTDPEIHIVATTVIPQSEGDVEVTVAANGPLDDPRVTLSSSPPLSERELASLIVTGRPDVTLDTSTAILGRHAASLLAGRFTRQISRELMSLGFDQVDIQPELLAREGDPRARFVFAKQVSRTIRLIWGMGLNDPEARYYQAQIRFRPGREITLKAQREETGSYTYAAGQRLRLGRGGRPPRLEEEKTRLREVNFPDETPVPEAVMRRWIKARPGKRVTFWDLVDDADRIQDRLVDMGFIEALADAHLHEEVAHFHVRTGPRYTWRVEGMENPPDLADEIRESLYEEEALERGRERVLLELRRRGHLRGEVKTAVLRPDGGRTLVFTAQPGPVLRVQDVVFPGAAAFSPDRLLEAAGGGATMVADPRQAQERVRQFYRQEHYLVTKVQPPEIVEENGQLRISMPVEEGPRARLKEVRLVGSSLPPEELSPLITIEAGDDYDPLVAADTVLRLRDRYLELGYPSVRVSTSLVPAGPDLELLFQVSEGQHVVVGDIVIKGLRRTRESLVRRQINIQPGDVLDPRDLSTLERRLIDLGIFSRAVVIAGEGSPATITIELEEEQRYLVAYDLRYNPEEGGSGLIDVERSNLFGRGWAIGGRHRRGRGLDESRASFHIPSLFRGGDLTLSAFRLRDDRVTEREARAREFGLPIAGGRLLEMGYQAQQALHFIENWDILYGYRYRRVRTRTQEATEWTVQDVGAIDLAAVFDTRLTPLFDVRRGVFLSANLELAPKVLGSDLDFVKGFTQFSLTLPLNRSLTWAQGYRVGLAFPFGGRLVSFERFRAGGSNTIRGYASDSLGPIDQTGFAGGEAVVILNQELRYQHPSGLGAAVFYDTGNVFATVQDLDFDLRHAIGVGLRYDSPMGLLRLDFGIPLNKRPGEESYQIFFGLGQAF